VQQRRLRARVRLGQSARDTEAECRNLLAIGERVGSCGDVVQIRSLLAQTLVRMGKTDDAIRIAEESVILADANGDEGLAGEATLRLAVTLSVVRPLEAVELLLHLIARARSRHDRVLEARAFLSLGVARNYSRNHHASAEAFRAALEIAREAQALDVAATASMNLGVLELRRGDFVAADDACKDALRLYTTLRNNVSRLTALYNLASLERERGDAEAALAIYLESSALAEQLGSTDLAIASHAGAGLAALRFDRVEFARASLAAAEEVLAARPDWWFQGRELFESLVIRLAVHDRNIVTAERSFHAAVARLEMMEVYSAAWMVADCAAELADHTNGVWKVVDRFAAHPAVREYVPLAARFTALRDIADRPSGARASGQWRQLSTIVTQEQAG
jgi:tetratricopeptide (TPR) repeat protein